jgi:hypothetical protein
MDWNIEMPILLKMIREKRIIWIFLALTSCSKIELKPLHTATSQYDCFGEPDNPSTIYSEVEENLKKSGALKSKKIQLKSGIGMIEKSVRLYSLNNKRFTIVLHMSHLIHLDINDYKYIIKNEGNIIASGSLTIDSKTTTGNLTDEYLYSDLSVESINNISNGKKSELVFNEFSFEMPYGCMDTFRNILKIGAKNSFQ